jgi:hypothetical protein
MGRYVSALLVVTALLLKSQLAYGSPQYPDLIKAQLGVSCTPACTICHSNPNGGMGTVNTPFGREMTGVLGLTGSNPASLQKALNDLKAQNLNAIGDGIPDIEKLTSCVDPNVAQARSDGGEGGTGVSPANVSLDPTPEYGCAVGRTPDRASGGAVLGALGILVWLRRRRGPARAWSNLCILASLAQSTAACNDNGNGGACDAAGLGDAKGDAFLDGALEAASDRAAIDASGGDAPRMDGAGAAAEGALSDGMGEAAMRLDASSDGDATTTSVAGVRVANWSPDAPAVDFCLAPHGSGAFQGPFLGSRITAQQEAGTGGDAGSAALFFPQVSSYSYMAAGQYDARVVVAAAPDCSTGIVPDATMLPAVGAGAFETIALLGVAQPTGSDPGLQLVGFLDDARPSGAVALRFIEAAPGIAKADFGTGPATGFSPLFLGVPFGHASTPQQVAPSDGAAPMVDANGYRSMPALSSVVFSAHLPGATQDSAISSSRSAGSGSVLTIALVGRSGSAPAGDGGAPQGQLVECIDNAGTVGALASCSVISQ